MAALKPHSHVSVQPLDQVITFHYLKKKIAYLFIFYKINIYYPLVISD